MKKVVDKSQNIFIVILIIIVFLFSIFSTIYFIKKTDNYIELISPMAADEGTLDLCVDAPPPDIDLVQAFNLDSGVLFEYNINATSPSNRTIYYYDNTNMFDINVSTGFISFIPSADDIGLQRVTITATHGICDGVNSTMLLFLCIDCGYIPPAQLGRRGVRKVLVYPCEENWTCGSWSECENLSILTEQKVNLTKLLCIEHNIPVENCGLQTRFCVDLNSCNTTIIKPVDERACYVVLPVVEPMLINETIKELGIGENITFKILEGQQHVLEVLNLTNITAHIRITSEPIEATLTINETKEFNLDEDAEKELSIKLINITNNKAKFVIKDLSKPKPIVPLKPEIRKCSDNVCEFNELLTCFGDCWIFWLAIFLIISWPLYYIIFYELRKLREEVEKYGKITERDLTREKLIKIQPVVRNEELIKLVGHVFKNI